MAKDKSDDTHNTLPFNNVTRPEHYNKNGIECIQAIEASMTKEEFEGALKANVIKYLWRYKYKNGIEDLKKAQWYLTKLIETSNKKYERETQISKE